MGISSKSQTQTYTPSAQQTQAANALTSSYNANAGNVQSIASQLSGLIPGTVSTANTANSAAGSAASYYGDVLGGKYLDAGNPYLSGIISSTDNAVTDKVNGAFSAAGRTGSGANTYALAKALSENENNLRYSDYNTQMQRMDSAASGAGSLNSSTLGSLLGLSSTAAGLPTSAAQGYASGIAGLNLTGATTKTATPSTADQIGKGLQIAQLIFSDRRLKVDVERVGEHPDGLGIYDYRYVWGGPMQRGVMADEVERLRPWALGPRVGGFATVDYGIL